VKGIQDTGRLQITGGSVSLFQRRTFSVGASTSRGSVVSAQGFDEGPPSPIDDYVKQEIPVRPSQHEGLILPSSPRDHPLSSDLDERNIGNEDEDPPLKESLLLSSPKHSAAIIISHQSPTSCTHNPKSLHEEDLQNDEFGHRSSKSPSVKLSISLSHSETVEDDVASMENFNTLQLSQGNRLSTSLS
jgi:hypothetical protein